MVVEGLAIAVGCGYVLVVTAMSPPGGGAGVVKCVTEGLLPAGEMAQGLEPDSCSWEKLRGDVGPARLGGEDSEAVVPLSEATVPGYVESTPCKEEVGAWLRGISLKRLCGPAFDSA